MWSIKLADDLKEEKSQSLSLSRPICTIAGATRRATLLVEGFYTDLSDVFALTDLGVENGVLIIERGNGEKPRCTGLTVEGKLAWRNIWQLQAGVTLQKADCRGSPFRGAMPAMWLRKSACSVHRMPTVISR